MHPHILAIDKVNAAKIALSSIPSISKPPFTFGFMTIKKALHPKNRTKDCSSAVPPSFAFKIKDTLF